MCTKHFVVTHRNFHINCADYDQACVARKWFNTQWFWNVTTGKKNGLDDYVCAYPHWVVCQGEHVSCSIYVHARAIHVWYLSCWYVVERTFQSFLM